mgnify:FL=1
MPRKFEVCLKPSDLRYLKAVFSKADRVKLTYLPNEKVNVETWTRKYTIVLSGSKSEFESVVSEIKSMLRSKGFKWTVSGLSRHKNEWIVSCEVYERQ